MRRSPIVLLVVLSATLSFGSAISDQELAGAVLRAVRQHPGMPNPNSVQVFNVIATGENVCMEYQVTTQVGGMRTGYAVYKADKGLVYIDNEWIWKASCMSGKYGQYREGKDISESVSAELELRKRDPEKQVVSTSEQRKPGTRFMGPAPRSVVERAVKIPVEKHAEESISIVTPTEAVTPVARSAQGKASASKREARQSVTEAASEMISIAAPVARESVAVATRPMSHPTSITESPAKTAAPQAVVVTAAKSSLAPSADTVVPASASVVAEPQRVTPTVRTQAPQPAAAATMAAAPANPATTVMPASPVPAAQSVAVSASASISPAVPITTEPGTVRGVTILDATGALGRPTPTAPGAVAQESLADAARRVKRAKQQ